MSETVSSHQLNLRKPYLKLIADGIKTVEVRVGYPKMRRIKAGHELTFVSGDDTVVTRVKRVTEYDSFKALLDHDRSAVPMLAAIRDNAVTVRNADEAEPTGYPTAGSASNISEVLACVTCRVVVTTTSLRSEERRVGKEC